MSQKSEVNAMVYLSKIKPKKYRLINNNSGLFLQEKKPSAMGGYVWSELHRIIRA